MKFYVFKQIHYKPQAITSLVSDDEHIYIFRSNKTCDVLNSISQQQIFSFDVNATVYNSIVYQDSIVCVSDLDEIIFINKKDFCIKIRRIGYKIMDFLLYQKKLIVITYNGLLLEIQDEKINIRYRNASNLFCLTKFTDAYLIGGNNKLFILREDFTIKNEFDFEEGQINKIVYIKESKFGIVTDKGYFIYFDINLLHIVQKIKVRDSSLNILIFDSDTFYTSGVDSRLISYKLIKDKFIKQYQTDLHCGITKCGILDNNRILIGNTDGMMSVLVPKKDKFEFLKIYDSNVKVSNYKNELLINNKNNLEIFQLKFKICSFEKQEKNFISTKCSFKLNSDIKNCFLVKKCVYRNLLRVYNDFIFDSILLDRNLIYADKNNVNVLEITEKSIEQRDLPFLKNKKCKKITYDSKNIYFSSLTEQDFCVDRLTFEKKDNKQVNKIEQTNELLINKIDDYKIMQEKSYEIKKKYIIYKNNEKVQEVEIYDIIKNIFLFNNEIWYFTQSYLYNVTRNIKFDFEYVIYDVKVINNNITIIKDDLRYIQKYVEHGVYKKKYSTK